MACSKRKSFRKMMRKLYCRRKLFVIDKIFPMWPRFSTTHHDSFLIMFMAWTITQTKNVNINLLAKKFEYISNIFRNLRSEFEISEKNSSKVENQSNEIDFYICRFQQKANIGFTNIYPIMWNHRNKIRKEKEKERKTRLWKHLNKRRETRN